MANYKRVISYMYMYRNQLKGSNVGFARIETRDTECKITIHIRVPNMKEQDVRSYIYSRFDKEMHGVLLGNVHINNGVGELIVKTDVDNILNSKYRLQDMNGILLYVSEAQYLATEWDGGTVILDTLKVDTVKPADFIERRNNSKQGQLKAASIEEATLTVQKPEQVSAEQSSEHDRQVIKEALNSTQVKSELEELIDDEVARESSVAVKLEEDQEIKTSEIDTVEQEKEQAESLIESEKNSDNELNPEGTVQTESKEDSTEQLIQPEESVLEPEIEQEIQSLGAEEISAPDELAEEQTDDLRPSSTFPLSQEKIKNLDKEAEELFGTMLFNSLFPEPKEEQPSDSPSDQVQKEDVSGQETEEVEKQALKVSPKTAIECFTAFRSCESEDEYKEIQEEIKTMKAQIAHLELLLKEWRIKEARLREEREARKEAEIEKKLLEEKIRESYHIEGVGAQLEAAEAKGGVVQRIFSKYPKMEAFVDDDVEDCIRIEPQDLGIFPMENWILANNSFLLHGYYSYRHLIFVMVKENGKHRYFLGVPGINHNRERFMANMFGFSNFRTVEKKEDGSSEFGYWCHEIKM